ncbi:glycosyl hydrolase family 18 protein [Parablautia muri]|uniref:LysM peptidoglycan-binding domain-containing protein n=1 Tax=Parablautia muri TaxID=2320879 RepID=A0A9X5BH18_9FIRM|nr:glycosyl hydrolase family 18 protein [Parablautia muri]NBJ92782.1 LysM peptidoglycan-binding domain-containing protein [Parablautia muri]
MEIYVVKKGDTVDSIADSYGISVPSIIFNNQLIYPYPLAIGQALLLSTEGANAPTYPAFVNGYAYPFIEQNTLDETLPFLSSLSVFSYGFTTDGELIPPALNDAFMIRSALSAGVRPILTLTPFGADGNFNNFLITSVINSNEAKNNLLSALLATLQEKGFQGVDIDFEYILPQDRIAFADFVADVRNFLSPYGYHVSVALAPKTSDNQAGLLYEGKDYSLLGQAADSALLMTYEWGYTYGPPMAVAPINQVRQVVDYAVTRIAPSKIDLGIPNYGYDWTLPYIRGNSKAKTISNLEAVQLAIDAGVPIQFDETAMSPFFQYEKDGQLHEVWFEDVRSYKEKFSLLPLYSLRGMGYWQIMRFFRPNWLLLESTFVIQ